MFYMNLALYLQILIIGLYFSVFLSIFLFSVTINKFSLLLFKF